MITTDMVNQEAPPLYGNIMFVLEGADKLDSRGGIVERQEEVTIFMQSAIKKADPRTTIALSKRNDHYSRIC